jgi:hypothetical protein
LPSVQHVRFCIVIATGGVVVMAGPRRRVLSPRPRLAWFTREPSDGAGSALRAPGGAPRRGLVRRRRSGARPRPTHRRAIAPKSAGVLADSRLSPDRPGQLRNVRVAAEPQLRWLVRTPAIAY